MALSNLMTVADFWREANRDLNSPPNVLAFEKFHLINRVCQITQGLLADVVSEAYMKDTTAVPSTTGKYGTTGTFAVATGILTATMNSDFGSGDIGNMIVLRTGANVYIGQISTQTSGTVVVLSGDNLPATDVASFDTITMASTTPTGDTVNIGSLRMLRYGSQVRLQILSTATTQVVVVKIEDFPTWPTAAPQNSNTIIWTLVGKNVQLKRG